MRHIVKPKQLTDIAAPQPKVADPSDISVARLIDDGLLVLYREIKNLMMLSVHGKLEPTDAKDLRDHLKLLFELKDREGDSLRGLTDEEIKAKATEALNEQD